jgi:hypothetical protein
MSSSSRSDAQSRVPPDAKEPLGRPPDPGGDLRSGLVGPRSHRVDAGRLDEGGPAVLLDIDIQRGGDATHLAIAVAPQIRVVEQVHVRLGSGVPVRQDLVAVVGEPVGAAAGRLHVVVDEPPQVRSRLLRGIIEGSFGGRFGTHRGLPQLHEPIESFVVPVIEVG